MPRIPESYPGDAGELGSCPRLTENVPNFNPNWSMFANFGPGWAETEQIWKKLGQIWAIVGLFRLKLTNTWSTSTNSGRPLASVDQFCSKLAETWPTSAQIWPTSTTWVESRLPRRSGTSQIGTRGKRSRRNGMSKAASQTHLSQASIWALTSSGRLRLRRKWAAHASLPAPGGFRRGVVDVSLGGDSITTGGADGSVGMWEVDAVSCDIAEAERSLLAHASGASAGEVPARVDVGGVRRNNRPELGGGPQR